MKHVMGPTTEPPEPVALERIIDRILFLEGVPNMQRLGAVTIGESVPEQLQIQLEGEREALKVLADGIKVSLEEGDDASREFFASSLLEEGAARRLVRDRTLSDRPGRRGELPRPSDPRLKDAVRQLGRTARHGSGWIAPLRLGPLALGLLGWFSGEMACHFSVIPCKDSSRPSTPLAGCKTSTACRSVDARRGTPRA